MLAESQDEEQIIARVAAIDIGKAEKLCRVRIPGPEQSKKRLQEVNICRPAEDRRVYRTSRAHSGEPGAEPVGIG